MIACRQHRGSEHDGSEHDRRAIRGTRRATLAGLTGLAGLGGALGTAACGPPAPATPAAPALDPNTRAEIRLATRAGQADSPLWNDLVAHYNQLSKQVQVTNEEYPSNEFHPKIIALSAAGSAPDVAQSSDEPFFDMAHKGIWYALDDFVARDRRAMKTEDFWPGVFDFWRWDATTKVAGKGKLYGLPRAAGTELFIYNKRVFQEAGVAEPPANGNWTWGDFLERARKLVRREGDELVRAVMPLPSLRSAIPWLIGNGAPNTADVTKRVGTLNNPATIDVLRRLADYRLKERIVPSVAETRGSTFRGNGYDLLLKGHYAMRFDIGYRSRIREAFKSDPEVWDVALVPKGTRTTAVRGAWSPFGMSGQTKQPAAAWEFMKYATGPEGQTKLTELGYLYSVRKSVAEKVFVDPSSPQHEERWLEAVKFQHFEPLNEVYEKVRQVHNYYWNQITNEQIRRPVNEAVRLADEIVNKIYQGGDIPADWEGLPKQ
ncbi:MAG: ABC transporter substrate-binding protein [Chloroflexota bacterium]